MEITPVGIFLVLVAAYCFIASPEKLYWFAIFFLPFSATAVVNIGSNGSFSGLQAWMFFGTLWIARQSTVVLLSKKNWYRKRTRASVRKLWIFLFVALFSLIMPLWIDGRLSIRAESPLLDDAHPLFFNGQHVTQILYLVYGALFAVFVAIQNANFGQFIKTVRIIFMSSVFVNCWGLLQWFCFQQGINYPAFLLNTNKNETAMGFSAQFSELGVPRISSVATEPSILAQYLLIVLVFALFSVFDNQIIISKVWDRSVLILAVLLLLLTTSSNALLGLLMIVPLFLVTFWLLGRLRLWHMAFVLSLLVMLIVALARMPIIQDLADTIVFSKADSYSGLERINSILLAKDYFLQYPVLGVGWGSVTSHDLVFKLLANTGIAGLIAFALFLKSLATGLWWSATKLRQERRMPPWSYWACCMLVGGFILVFTSIFTEFTYVFGHLWFVFGMGLAVPLGQEIWIKTHFQTTTQATV